MSASSAAPVLDIVPPSIEVPTCCGSAAPPTPADAAPAVATRFHFSLNVSDLARSVEFYTKLFGVAPAKNFPDYAKFELAQPPLVFSLVPNAPASTGALSHLGFPVSSREEVEATALRLREAGLEVSCQNGTVCGYAKQDKIWIADPDHNYWEVYVIHADIDPAEVRRAFDGVSPLAAASRADGSAPAPAVIWEHRVTEGAPAAIPHADGSVDEVRLTGTFNAALSEDERRHLLMEARRVLKAGGLLSVHGLMSSEPLTGGPPSLPGVAALVKRVPTEAEPIEELRAAGFVGVQMTKLPASAVFTHGAAELREVKLAARAPSPADAAAGPRLVVYKGPFAATQDDAGTTYVRGRRTEISARQWHDLAQSAAAGQFLFLDGRSETACGG